MSVELKAETLHLLDQGAAGFAIDGAIATALRDLDNRGDDEKPRKITIVLSLTKDRNVVDATVEVKSSVPAYKTGRTIAQIEGSGKVMGAFFSPDSPGNPNQPTIPGTGDAA